MMYRPTSCVLFALAMALGSVATAQSSPAISVEKGYDVGDGQVLYDTPFDPADVSEVTFYAPTTDHPYYEIVVPMGDWTDGKDANFSKVSVNGVNCESYYVFVDGFAHVQSGWLTRERPEAKNVVLVARTLWHNGESVTIDVELSATDAEGKAATIAKNYAATAPKTGGGPAGWKRYQSVVLEEKAGLNRDHEPVEFSIAARAENCGDLEKELRVFAVNPLDQSLTALPFQTFNPGSFGGTPPGTANENYLQHPSRFIDVVTQASVAADGKLVLVACYDNPDAAPLPAPKTDLKVTGESLSAVVENDYFTAKLDDKSGQIASFTLKGRATDPVPLLTNSQSGALHWNPDSFGDNGLWGHTFSWDPPEKTVVTTRGPFLFRITNSGRMPGSTPQIWASVTYSFYAYTPYVNVTTSMEVRETFNANAIRNGEVVLDTHLVDHFVWEEKSGAIKTIRTLHGPNWQDEWSTRVDADIPWLAMTNEVHDYGIGAVNIAATTFNPDSGEATLHRPAYYLYYHHFWGTPLTYFTRGWVYPFSDYQRGPIIVVKPGSTYLEKMALTPFFLQEGAGRYKAIADVSTSLKQPLEQRWGR